VADPEATLYLSDKAIYVRSDWTAAANLAKALASIRDPLTGAHPIKRAWDARELYGSLATDDWHVLILEQGDGYTLRTGSLSQPPFEPILAGRDYLAGTHTATGFWLMAGRGVEPGREIEAGVTDLAPAILNVLGVPVPGWMEGDPAVVVGNPR
jgi:hypothetical protein